MSKWQFVIFFFLGFAYSYQQTTLSKCLWHNNSCVEKCPDHMVIKESDCTQSYWPAQRTCDHPAIILMGTVCGYSRCDCPDPMVLDTDTGFCYDVDNCPTKHI